MQVSVGFVSEKERKAAMARLPVVPCAEIMGCWVTLRSRRAAAEFVKRLVLMGACFDVVTNG